MDMDMHGSPNSNSNSKIRSGNLYPEAAYYPLPPSAAISRAESPVDSFYHHGPNANFLYNQQQQHNQPGQQFQSFNQNGLSGSLLDGALAINHPNQHHPQAFQQHQRQQSHPPIFAPISSQHTFPFQDPQFNLNSSVQRDSDGSGGTISPSPANPAGSSSNAHPSQYKSPPPIPPMNDLPSGVPVPVNHQQFIQQQQPTIFNQNHHHHPHPAATGSASALPHYLINPDALSNALSDWQNMNNASSSSGGGNGSGNSRSGKGHQVEKTSWSSAPVSAGASPPATPGTGGGGAKHRSSHGPSASKSNAKKKNTGSLTTGSTTPGGAGISSAQFSPPSSSNLQNQNQHQHQHQASDDPDRPPAKVTGSSRVASSSVTGKRLNWAEMIVFTIADQPDGRMVIHDLFEGMVKKFPEINEWADGPGWESRVKNRIKSTLSIKGNLFVKVARASTEKDQKDQTDQKSKGSWWTLSEESLTALREGNVPAVVRAKPGKVEKDGKNEPLKEAGHERERGRESSSHNGGRSGTSSAAHSRRSSPVRVGNSARSARGVGSGHHLSKGQQEIQAMTMSNASPKNLNHAGLYGMTSYNPQSSNQQQQQQYNQAPPNFQDSPTSPTDAASPESVSSNPGGSSRSTFQSSSLAMSPASTTTSPPPPGMPFPWVGNASASSTPPPQLATQDQVFPPLLNLGGISTPSGPGYPSGLNGLDSLTMPFDPSSEENDRHSSPSVSSRSLASGSGSGTGSSGSRGASEELSGMTNHNHAQRRGGSSTSSGARPTGSRRGSLEHVSFTLPVDGSAINHNNRGQHPQPQTQTQTHPHPHPASGQINPPNSNPSNKNLSSGEWQQLQQYQRQELSEQRFKQQLQSSLLRQQEQQEQEQERERGGEGESHRNENLSPPYRFTNPLTGGGDENPSNGDASSIPTSPFYHFSSLNDQGNRNSLDDLGLNFDDLNGFGAAGNGDPIDINGMGIMDLDLDDGLLMMNNDGIGLEDPSKRNVSERGNVGQSGSGSGNGMRMAENQQDQRR